MNPTEQSVLYSVKRNLLSSINHGWTDNEGDIDAWAKWAREMKNAIIQNTEILNSILEVDATGEVDNNNDKNTLDNILP